MWSHDIAAIAIAMRLSQRAMSNRKLSDHTILKLCSHMTQLPPIRWSQQLNNPNHKLCVHMTQLLLMRQLHQTRSIPHRQLTQIENNNIHLTQSISIWLENYIVAFIVHINLHTQWPAQKIYGAFTKTFPHTLKVFNPIQFKTHPHQLVSNLIKQEQNNNQREKCSHQMEISDIQLLKAIQILSSSAQISSIVLT